MQRVLGLCLALVLSAVVSMAATLAYDLRQITYDGSAEESRPIIYGGTIVWEDWQPTADLNIDIHAFNMGSWQESTLVAGPGVQAPIGLSDRYVIYRNYFLNSATGYDLYRYDRLTKRAVPIVTAKGDQQMGDLSGNILVYIDGLNSGNLCAFNVMTGSRQLVANNAKDPRISGDKVLWVTTTGVIRAYNFSTRQSMAIAQGATPDISGNLVVWAGSWQPDHGIYAKNMTFGQTRKLSAQGFLPVVDGNIVAWIENDFTQENVTTVVIYDWSTGQSVKIPIGAQYAGQVSVSVSGNIVVWNSRKSGRGDIYAARLYYR